jgi:hypothetical protein
MSDSVRRQRWMILVIPALLGVICCTWSLHRTSDAVLSFDPFWPRPWPYPDQWLAALNDWYDARNPPPPDSLKIHGEWGRVQATVAMAIISCFWLLVISIVKMGVPGWLQNRRTRSRS